MGRFSSAGGSPAGTGVVWLDGEPLTLGTDDDAALVVIGSALAANEALSGVLVGTPVTAASTVASLLISNITALADIAFFLNDGSGNSWEWERFDSSAGLHVWNEAGSDIDHRFEGDTDTTLLVLDAGLDVAAIGGIAVSGIKLRLYGATRVSDDILLTLGSGGDVALVERSTILATNTILTGVLVGTPVTPAIAADSLILSNVTADGDILIAAQTGGNSQAWIWVDSSAGLMNLYSAGVARIALTTAIGLTGAVTVNTSANLPNDILLTLGTGGDVAFVENSAGLAANTALTGVLIGTPVTPAVAADSLIIANTTASGDILIAGNLGGNSRAYIFIDVSADTMDLMTAGVSRLLLSATPTFPDDEVVRFGTSGDDAFVHSSAGVAADTSLANVLIGTPVSEAVAANSLLISNVTASGDIAVYGNNGGNSHQFIFIDVSAGFIRLSVVPFPAASTAVMINDVTDAPAPDNVNLHLWGGSAGTVSAQAGTELLVESSSAANYIGMLSPNTATQKFLFGDADDADVGQIQYVHSTNTMTVVIGASTLLTMTAATMLMNDTTNANNTAGLTINQEATDDQILTFKSSDVATALTTIVTNSVETDDYAAFYKFAATTGGLLIQALGTNSAVTTNFQIESYGGQADATKTTAARGLIDLYASQHDGANALADVGANGNLVVFRGRSTTDVARFIFDIEGSAHADVEWIAFDQYDDLSLIADIEAELLRVESPAGTASRHALEATGIIGAGSWHVEAGKPRAMVNFTRLAQLHHGALIQVGQWKSALEQEIDDLRGRLQVAETKLAALPA